MIVRIMQLKEAVIYLEFFSQSETATYFELRVSSNTTSVHINAA